MFARSPDDVWAVGGQLQALGEDGVAVIARRDGNGWARAEAPADMPLLNWIHEGGGELWAVGNAGAAMRKGPAWERLDAPTDVPLWGVFVHGPNDVWAVGGDVFDADAPGVILRYDGSGWTELELPELDRKSSSFFKVWGPSPDSMYIVGDNGIIVHFDGTSLSQQLSGTTQDLISLWGSGPDDIVAVGGRSVGTLVRYDGSSWTPEDFGTIAGFNGVWVGPDGASTMVGNLGAAADVAAPSEELTVAPSGAGFNVLHAVYGFDNGTRFAVGGSIDRSPPWTGIIIDRIAE